MGDGGTDGAGESRRAGSGAGEAPARPARAEFPPTDGEVAARRLVAGHLDTTGLDPVTAKAVELLVTADTLAAEAYRGPQPKQRRLWHEPLWWLAICGLTALVLVSVAVLLLVQRSDEGKRSRDRLERVAAQQTEVLDQVRSCVDPAGACSQRGQQTTSKAVDALSRATLVIVECADRYDGDAQIDACVARRLADKG